MAYKTPWNYSNIDPYFYPPEEYRISRVEVNAQTGKEEIVHYSFSDLENEELQNVIFDDHFFNYY